MIKSKQFFSLSSLTIINKTNGGVYELYEGVRTLYQNGAFDPRKKNNSDTIKSVRIFHFLAYN